MFQQTLRQLTFKQKLIGFSKICIFLCTVLLISSCSQTLDKTTQAVASIDDYSSALFNDNALVNALTTRINSETELIGLEDVSTVSAIELPYVEKDLEVNSALSTQGVLTGATGYVALYRKNSSGTYQIRVHDQSNNANIIPVYSGTTEVQSVAVNGDASIVVASMRHPTNNTFDVYLFEVGTSNVYNLSNISSKDETNVSITRDGSKIAWQRDLFNGNFRPEICSYNAITHSCSLMVLTNSSSQMEPSLSANGDYLVFVRVLTGPTRYQILRYKFSDSSYNFVATKPAPDVYADPTVDDSGNKIMYLWKRSANSKNYIRINDLAANTASTEYIGGTDLVHPFMTADAAFVGFQQYITASGYQQIRTRNIATDALTIVQGGAWNYYQPSWMVPETAITCDNTQTITGNQTLTTQAQVNALSTIKIIDGDLIIDPITTSLDLSPLDGIIEITGDLTRASENTVQSEVSGFNCLETIGGDFAFNGTYDPVDFTLIDNGLTTISGFPKLSYIGNTFLVSGNISLISLSEFPALSSIGNTFYIYNNTTLPNIGDFLALVSVNGNFSIGSNDALISIGNFPVLSNVGGSFWINYHSTLASIGDFSALNTVGSYFEIWGNNLLTSIGDFSTLISINSSFNIRYNGSLTSLGNFSSLTSTTNFTIANNDSLTNIGDFSNLTALSNFKITNNALLTSVSNFPMLTNIYGDFEIEDNLALTSISNFISLTTLYDDFKIEDNAALISIANFPVLTSTDEFIISDNASLTSITNFPALSNVWNDFEIEFNDSLTYIPSFSALNSVWGDFSIAVNDSLTSIPNFSSLSYISGKLRIRNNDALTSIGGLSALNNIGGSLFIGFNDALASIPGFDLLTPSGITGVRVVNYNPMLNCGTPQPTFAPVTISTGNLVNCPTQ